jgi:ABC-type multidrug transport system fused ATPase/permease subunit
LTYHLPVFLAIEISGKLFDSLLAGNLFRRDGNAGDVYSLLIDEVKRFTHLVMTPLMMCLQRLSTLLVYLLVGIYLYGIKVLLLGLLIIPLLLVLNFQKKYRIEIDRKIIESQSIRSETVQTAQSDNIHISSYYPARFIAERFSGSTDVFFKTYANASILVDSQRVLLDIVILFSCVFIGFFQPNSQNDMSSKVMFILILFRAGPQVLALLNAATQISTNIGSVNGILQSMSLGGLQRQIDDCTNALEGVDVLLKNGKEIQFNRGINLVVGPSGCGKSTLLEDLVRNDRVLVNKIKPYPLDNLQPSYISSKPKIFSGGFEINRFDECVKLEKFELNIRYLFNESLNKSAINHLLIKADVPSLGQLQRIAIARVLASDSNFIAIDETLSGLDAATLNRLLSLLESSGAVVVIATHDERLLGRYQIAYEFL